MSRFRSVSIVTAVLAISAANCLTQDKPIAPPAVSPVENPDASQEVFIGSGDLLTVSVTGAPEYRYEVRVNAYGEASLPMVGNIKLAGLSIYEAEKKIAQRSGKEQVFSMNPRYLFS